MTMELRCHGAVEGVTGSCYELKDDSLNVHMLIDCGMFQGEPTREMRNVGPLPYDPRSLTHVLLTHAHLDHVGMLPRLYKGGYTGSVYATVETQDLARAVLYDAMKIGAPYEKRDIDAIKWHEPGKAVFGNYCAIANDVFIRFFRSSHILGAVSITVIFGSKGEQRSITFSGDLGVNADGAEQMPLLGYRMSPVRADYLVVESTYGATVRPPLTMSDRLAELKGHIDDGLFNRGGTVVIPAFAIGRTQEVICDLSLIFAREPSRYRDIPVYVDGNMNDNAGRILARQIGRTFLAGRSTKVRNAWLGAGLFEAVGLDKDDPDHMDMIVDCLKETFGHERPTGGPREGLLANWRGITSRVLKPQAGGQPLAPINGPAIVIAGAGMCEAGPVQRHLFEHLFDPAATVLFTGYCGGGTIGSKLFEHGALAESERRRDRRPITLLDSSFNKQTFEARTIRATIAKMSGYSAHADQAGVLN